MNQTVTFDGAPPPGTINLGVGQPSADLLPVELLAQASAGFLAGAQPFDLNYGPLAGDPRFLDVLAQLLTREYAAATDPQSLLATGGNSQALDLVSSTLAKPGATVLVEEPSYFLAFQIFRDHGLKPVGVPLDEDGINLQALEAALGEHRPALLYTIPSYHNPAGLCSSYSRRQRLVALAEQHDFVIVADEAYQLLHYAGTPPPAMGTMIDSERVISLGSFSKILAPGMRLGWIQAAAPLREKILAAGFINSGGSINHLSSHLVRSAIELGLLEAHLVKLRQAYSARVVAMDRALGERFAALATWLRPAGGYFFWLRFTDPIDTGALRELARTLETGFQPGPVFSTGDGLGNCLRLSFAHYREDDIIEGIARLRRAYDRL